MYSSGRQDTLVFCPGPDRDINVLGVISCAIRILAVPASAFTRNKPCVDAGCTAKKALHARPVPKSAFSMLAAPANTVDI